MFVIKEERKVLFERKIHFLRVQTDEGIQVVIAGGDRSHIGSITIIDYDGTLNTTSYPGHKDYYISENWARRLHDRFRVPVVVSVGIHYDHISKEQIQNIMQLTDDTLNLFLEE